MAPVSSSPVGAAAASAAPTAAMRRAAQAFEAQVLSQLLAPAFATVDMGRSAFAGVAEAVLREMLRWQGNAAAPGGGGEDDAR